ncbi:MAG: GspH/FimT family pseudopilin [Gemmatimonadetes bacterium]|nr:GspH/FimT family pseudopilin [Gemmatimonadota bacterium]
MSAPRRGYTLLELTVVVAILALALAVAAPAIAGWRPPNDAEAARAELISALRFARARAVNSGGAVTLVVDPSTARVWLRPRDTTFALALPGNCRLVGAARSAIRFSPDGPALGEVPALHCGAEVIAVAVDALTGEARAGGRP